jgi:hypothetical protein
MQTTLRQLAFTEAILYLYLLEAERDSQLRKFVSLLEGELEVYIFAGESSARKVEVRGTDVRGTGVRNTRRKVSNSPGIGDRRIISTSHSHVSLNGRSLWSVNT